MSKNFRIHIVIRILILSLLIGLFIYFTFVDLRWLRAIYLAAFFIIAVVEFIWYVDRTNRDFTSFLHALLQNDFTTTFSESGKGKSFNNLYKAFNQITQRFESISSAKEVQHLYLEGLVEHVRVGIISFDADEKIQLMNQAFQQLIGKPSFAYLNSLQSVDESFLTILREIKPKENKLIKIKVKNELLQLSVHASEFLLNNEYYKLISIQDIKNQLDANELDAWQKLIRVLTHEIMNSVTPITSLSDSLRTLIQSNPDESSVSKIKEGLNAIHTRSLGLQHFTESYKKLTKVPVPSLAKENLKFQIDQLLTLLEKDLKGIKVTTHVSDKIDVFMDKDLMNQVFLNLIKNAIDALRSIVTPELTITANQDTMTTIQISDNGSGIDEDKLDQIFIPFFTTKENGSGIGLALSRQIVQKHNGSIKVNSLTNIGTTFTIKL